MIKKKIKLTYIIHSLNLGGAERFLLDLINNINKSEFEISVIIYKEAGSLIYELDASKVNYLLLEKKYKYDLRNFWKIYKRIKEIKPDIVHTQLGGDLVGRIAALLAGVKIIISTEQNINRGERCLSSCLKSITALFISEIVSISQAVQKESKKKYFIAAHKYKNVIYNGVDLNKYGYLKDKKINPNQILVGTASRLVEQKGLDLLIKAWAEIRPKNAQLIIGGNGPKKTDLETLIKLHSLEASVKLIGWPNSMPEFYHQLDLFVMPSRWEGLGIAALEAAASGTPMLLSDAGGLKEIANSSETWICQANNLNSLVLNLKKAISEITKAETDINRRNLRDRMEKIFSNSIIAEKYTSLYYNLLKRKNENPSS